MVGELATSLSRGAINLVKSKTASTLAKTAMIGSGLSTIPELYTTTRDQGLAYTKTND